MFVPALAGGTGPGVTAAGGGEIMRSRGDRMLPASVLLLLAGCSGPDGSPPATGSEPVAVEGAAISADGAEIHYRSVGQGEPTLVFVHCWSCDSTYWDAQVAAFASIRRVVTLDLAGHGRSSRDREEWTVPAYAADVQAVIEDLDLREVVLVGHSMGGPIIVEVARRLPDRIAALIPVDTIQDAEFRFEPGQLEQFLAPFRDDFPGAVTGFVQGMFADGADPVLVAAIAADMAAAPPDVAVASLEELFSFDLAGALSQIGVPIRAINGERFPTEVEVNRRYAPQFEVATMAGVGHFPMRERPDEFNRQLDRAVAELTAAPGRH